MAEYVLKPGKVFYHQGKKLTGGAIVELNDNQAEAFKDLFDPVGKVASANTEDDSNQETETVEVETVGKPLGGKSTLPQMRHTSSGTSSTGKK